MILFSKIFLIEKKFYANPFANSYIVPMLFVSRKYILMMAKGQGFLCVLSCFDVRECKNTKS